MPAVTNAIIDTLSYVSQGFEAETLVPELRLMLLKDVSIFRKKLMQLNVIGSANIPRKGKALILSYDPPAVVPIANPFGKYDFLVLQRAPNTLEAEMIGNVRGNELILELLRIVRIHEESVLLRGGIRSEWCRATF